MSFTNELHNNSTPKIIGQKFPNDFKLDGFKQENISTKKQEVTQEMRDRVGEYVSEYDWKLLKLAEEIISNN